jgi:hypothetical protein
VFHLRAGIARAEKVLCQIPAGKTDAVISAPTDAGDTGCFHGKASRNFFSVYHTAALPSICGDGRYVYRTAPEHPQLLRREYDFALECPVQMWYTVQYTENSAVGALKKGM